MTIRLLLSAATTLALAGCMTTSEIAAGSMNDAKYQPEPGYFTTDIARSGYTEKQTGQDAWTVTAMGTPVTNPVRVHEIAELRAAELGRQHGSRYYRVVKSTDHLHCDFVNYNALHGVLTTEMSIEYAKGPAPDFKSADAYVAENMARVRSSAAPENVRALNHTLMQAACQKLKESGAPNT